MLETALGLDGPVGDPLPQDPAPPRRAPTRSARVCSARRVRAGDGSVCLLGVGKLLAACEDAAAELAVDGRRRHRLGRPGGQPARPRACWPTRPPPPRGHRRGRRALRRGRACSSSTPRPRRPARRVATPASVQPRDPPRLPPAGQGRRHPGRARPRRTGHRGQRPPGPRDTGTARARDPTGPPRTRRRGHRCRRPATPGRPSAQRSGPLSRRGEPGLRPCWPRARGRSR